MELLYIVGILIALALLWRGAVWLRDYRRRIRIRLEPVPPGPGTVDTFPELGKVRVRPRLSGDEDSADDEPTLGPVIVVGARDRDDTRSPRVAAVSPANLRGPAVVEPVASPSDDAAALLPVAPVAAAFAPPAPVPERPVAPDLAAPAVFERKAPAQFAPPAATVEISSAAVPPTGQLPSDVETPVLVSPVSTPLVEAEQRDMFADQTIAPPPMPGRSRTRAQALYGATTVEPVRPVRPLPEERPHVEIQDVIALHVVARQHPFNGEDLLRCILGFGLRFGDMAIFHRHERPTGQGKVLFSMAKAVEPGTFDLHAMSGEEIPGVTLFLSLPGVNSIHAYDIMVDTAKRLAIELQGEILDEQQQPMTRQLVEHYRERVQEFERRRLMQRPSH